MTREEQLAIIKQADHKYYDLDNPSMSDAEYDKLRRDYIAQYGADDLNYVPGDVADGFEKFRHPTPVTSLGKWTKGVDDEKDLLVKIEKLWPVEIQPKYDGLTVVAYPNADGSCKFVTRGLGGEVGEVLPNFIPEYEGTGVNNSSYAIRGEVYITPTNFKELNNRLKADGEELMKNMRNAAAGLLRRKERSPYLNLLSYTVYDLPGQDKTPQEMRKIVNEQTKFNFTDGMAFGIIRNDYDYDYEYATKRLEEYYNDINNLELYPIDGIVVKSCQENSLARFGYTEHHPHNAFAWKNQQKEQITILRDVVWQMGRSKATPVGIVEPVQIDGTTVTRVSLHNAEQIKKLGLKINSVVGIVKANQIIPQITRVIEPGDKDIVLDVCPACGNPLEEINGQQFCTNPDCMERIAQNIAFIGSKDVLDIPGLSIQTARKIVAKEKYKDKILEKKQNFIFTLSKIDFMQLEGFGYKSAQKLFAAITAARKNIELPRFIKALCIPGIGKDIGKILADEFKNLDAMYLMFSPDKKEPRVMIERLQAINGIGPVVAKKLVSKEFWDAVDELSKYLTIAPYKKIESITTSDFINKTFVLTGKMEHPRSYYKELIESHGAKVSNTVTSNTDYLVIQDINSNSSKAKAASQLGTKLISPEELERMLK